ncbi:MAG: Hsp70 family protein [Hyphomonas sp.]
MTKAISTLGLDFGTTNSVAVLANADGRTESMTFSHEGETFAACRSVLCFWKDEDGASPRAMMEIGPWAIDQFLELGGDCRFIQSFKTFAASPLFNSTVIHNKNWYFEDLLSAYLRRLAERAGGDWPSQVVMGRPVQFAGVQADEALAQTRYETALKRLGFETIHHVYEPVAAAFFYAQRLREAATILVADFGGGTSDFSIIRFDPGGGKLRAQALSHAGIGIAGDAFDQKIIEHVVSPLFGKDSTFQSGDKTLPVPLALFSRFGQWNQLSIMRHTRDYADLHKLLRVSDQPELIQAFIDFLDADASYLLYRAVADVKAQLSRAGAGEFRLAAGSVDLNRTITRGEFDGWIGEDVRAIQSKVGEALKKANLKEAGIDRVFLTGGSSYVPALRESFEARFGAGKVETGDEFVSIANGLALIAQQDDLEPWLARGS